MQYFRVSGKSTGEKISEKCYNIYQYINKVKFTGVKNGLDEICKRKYGLNSKRAGVD